MLRNPISLPAPLEPASLLIHLSPSRTSPFPPVFLQSSSPVHPPSFHPRKTHDPVSTLHAGVSSPLDTPVRSFHQIVTHGRASRQSERRPTVSFLSPRPNRSKSTRLFFSPRPRHVLRLHAFCRSSSSGNGNGVLSPRLALDKRKLTSYLRGLEEACSPGRLKRRSDSDALLLFIHTSHLAHINFLWGADRFLIISDPVHTSHSTKVRPPSDIQRHIPPFMPIALVNRPTSGTCRATTLSQLPRPGPTQAGDRAPSALHLV